MFCENACLLAGRDWYRREGIHGCSACFDMCELRASDFCTTSTGPSLAPRSARQPNPLRSLLLLLLSIIGVASMHWRPLQ